jgi:TonB family protein
MNQREWFDGVARNLIRHAALKAPPELSERLEEEWLADLGTRSAAWSQLRFALGCCWATTVIAHECGAPVRAAASSAVGKLTVIDAAGSGPSFSRRTTVILLICGLHVLVICLLATAIVAPKVLKASAPPRIDVSFLPRAAHRDPPPPVDPTLDNFRINLPPPPGPVIATEPTVTARDPTTAVPPLGGPAGLSAPNAMKRVWGGPGVGFPNTDDFYPPDAIRRREMGIATVTVCVDGAGRLIGRPAIEESSGSARLDEGALKLAKAGSGHYRATTEDGRPVSACYPLRVRFKLRD